MLEEDAAIPPQLDARTEHSNPEISLNRHEKEKLLDDIRIVKMQKYLHYQNVFLSEIMICENCVRKVFDFQFRSQKCKFCGYHRFTIYCGGVRLDLNNNYNTLPRNWDPFFGEFIGERDCFCFTVTQLQQIQLSNYEMKWCRRLRFEEFQPLVVADDVDFGDYRQAKILYERMASEIELDDHDEELDESDDEELDELNDDNDESDDEELD